MRFLLNVPLPQEYFDHPGYLSILLLSWWLRALHGLGIVHVVSFTAVPPLSDTAGFASAWTAATRAGRVLSLLYAMGFVLAFSYLLRALVRDWRIAAFGGISAGVLRRHGDGDAHHAHRTAAGGVFHIRPAHADDRRATRRTAGGGPPSSVAPAC